ncbi:MAG TPA: biotin-dependent carboxyltransferase family protein [Xanthobacteraceae bacterium]|nr:biotin-dependent carboxyltransferase family protein [Xanthobacteraceae bacterium]
MVELLRVAEGGLFSSLQDEGRFGFQRFGISASGAMDAVALRLANALVGNPPGTAAIETTLSGPDLVVEAERCRIAVTGAEVPLAINGKPAALWCAHDLVRGDRLTLGTARRGLRAYVAVAGGFAVAPVLGSLSTHSRSRIGGLDGGPLRSGNSLPLRAPSGEGPCLGLDAAAVPDRAGPIRVVLGPQDEAFTPAGIATFLSARYAVSAKADRMGYQLEGPVVAHAAGFNIVSDGIVHGSIQVPGHGRPVILLADRQTTGGYPKIATVIGPDLFRLAQRRPGEEVRFVAVSAAEAEHLARSHESAVAAALRTVRAVPPSGGIVAERLLDSNLISGVISAIPEPPA